MPSRYGPPAYVQNESGEILANALMNATSGFMQKRRQNRQDAQQQLDWKVTHPYIHEGALGPDGNPLPATASDGHEGALSSLAHHLMSVPSAIGGAAKRVIGRGDETAPMPEGATPPATHGGQSVQPVLSGVDPMRYMPPELTPSALPTGASPEATRFAHMLDPMMTTAPRTRGLPPMVTTPTDGAHILDPIVSRAQGTNPLAAMQPQVTPSMGGNALAEQLLNVPGSRAPTGAGSGGAPVTSADRPSDGRDLAATHPGAFDVATRQFGGSDLQLATAAAHTNGPASRPGPDAPAPAPAQAGQPGQPAPTGPMGQPQMPQLPQPTGPRYSAIDRTHYIDNTETPAAVAERTRMQEQTYQLQLADYIRRTDPSYQANLDHVRAETEALRRKPTNIMRGPGGQLLDVEDPAHPRPIGPGAAADRMPRQFAEDGRAVEGFSDKSGKFYHADGTPATGRITPYVAPKEEPLVQVQQPDGSVVYVPRNQASGRQAPKKGSTSLPAPMAAKVGQFGEMLKKADDLLPIMDAIDIELSQSTAQDVAEHGLAHLPGTRGVGAMMVNRSPTFAKYQAALDPFILAAAHALSGARINSDQVNQIRKSIEVKPGESKESRAQKKKNLVDLFNSIGGSLPADAIAVQEGQLDAPAMLRLKGYGYQSVSAGGGGGRGEAGAAGAGSGAAAPPALTAADRAHAKRDPKYAAWLKAQGYTP